VSESRLGDKGLHNGKFEAVCGRQRVGGGRDGGGVKGSSGGWPGVKEHRKGRNAEGLEIGWGDEVRTRRERRRKSRGAGKLVRSGEGNE